MAIELANAYVTLSVETSSLGKQVGQLFNGVQAQSTRAGRDMGQSMAKAFEQSKPDISALEDEVKRTQQKVVAHKESGSRKIEAADRKVEIAQARVNETLQKYGDDSSQYLRANDQLVTAQQKSEAETLKYESALDKLESQLGETQTALKDAQKATEETGDSAEGAADKYSKGWRGVGQRLRDTLTHGVQDASSDAAVAAEQGGEQAGTFWSRAMETAVGVGLYKIGETAIKKVGGLFKNAFSGGFDRVQALDDAQAKLAGLGYEAQDVTGIMGDVESALGKTAFLYSDGASAAAGSMSALKEQGLELEGYLRLVSDATTQSNTDFNSMSQIMGKVVGDGKLTGATMQQMMDNGLQAAPMLAEAFEVTQAEVRDMASEGEISAEMFMEAMDEKIGGAAENAADTVSGSLMLAKTSISQFGESVLTNLAPYIQSAAGYFSDFMYSLAPMGEQIGEALGAALDWFPENIDLLKTVASVLGTVVGGMTAYFAITKTIATYTALTKWIKNTTIAQKGLNGAFRANPIGLVITAITALVAGFVWAYREIGWFKDGVDAVLDALGTGWNWLYENAISPAIDGIVIAWNWLADVFTAVWSGHIQPFLDGFVGAIETVKGAWGELTAAFQGGDEGFGFLADIFGENVAQIVVNTFGMIGDAFENIKGAWGELTAAFRGGDDGFGFLSEIFGDDVARIAVNTFAVIGEAFTNIKGAWGEFKAALSGGDDGYGFLAEIFGEDTAKILMDTVGMIGDAFQTIKGAWGELTAAFRGGDDGFGFLADIFGDGIAETIVNAFAWIGDAARNTVEGIGDAWTWLKGTVVSSWDNFIWPVLQGIGTGLTWLWENIVSPFLGFVIGLVLSVGEVFMWVWSNVLSPVVGFIGTAIVWLWQNIISPYIGMVGAFWGAVFQGMAWAWHNILMPVFGVIGTIVGWLWTNIISPYFSMIGAFWLGVFQGMGWAWENILAPVFRFIGAAAVWLWQNALSPAFTWIGENWSTLMDIMAWAWNYILKPVWDAMVSVATWLAFDILLPIFTSIRDKWTWLSDSVSSVYNNFLKPTFERFGEIVTDLKDKFTTAVDNIKKVWETLKGIAAKPIKFVIEKVINDGLISGFNSLIGLIPFMDLEVDPVPVPGWMAGYYDGGWTGPGSKYDPAGLVHADEFVVQKASRRIFERENPGLLDHINRHGTFAGYADGGLVRPVQGRFTSGFGASRGRYPHAGVDWAVPIGTPVAAALAGTVARVGTNVVTGRTGKGVFLTHDGNRNTYYGHLSAFRVAVGDQVSKGQTIALSGNTGNSTGPHLHFETWTGGSPVDPMKYMGGLPASESGGEDGGGWFDPLAPLHALGEKIGGWFTEKFPNGGFMVDAAKQTATGAIDGVIDWLRDVIPFMGDPEDTAKGTGTVSKGPVWDQVQNVAAEFGWGSGAEWSAVRSIVNKESSGDPNAKNPNSTASGLFQLIAANRTADYRDVPGHSRDGLGYIRNRYGTPSAALAFHNRNNWYADGGLVGSLTRDSGGVVPPGSSIINNWTRDPEWMYTNKQQDTVQDALDIAKNGARGNTYNIHVNRSGASATDIAQKLEFESRRLERV